MVCGRLAEFVLAQLSGAHDARRATSHMFTTLKNLLAFYGTGSKAIVWAHNSHVGDSAATEMVLRGEHNLSHLCRQEFGGSAYLVGFGTNSGTVAAASDWDGPMEIKKVQPALPKSYERLCHATGHPRFMLGLRNRAELTSAQAHRAILRRRCGPVCGWRLARLLQRQQCAVCLFVSHCASGELPRGICQGMEQERIGGGADCGS